MWSTPRLCHLLSWPDFLPTPRAWDLAIAASQARKEGAGCSWHMLLPAWSMSAVWSLYSSFDRDSVMEAVSAHARALLADERLVEGITEVAYEMAMNAMYDAPADARGHAKYSHDRQRDIALEDDEVPTLWLASDGQTLILQVDDRFGRLRREHILEGISRGLSARTAQGAGEVLNTAQGGAGLGIFRMFQTATSLIFDVNEGQATRVLALFDLTLRSRDRRMSPASLHLLFRP
jgi:hypothetical protein